MVEMRRIELLTYALRTHIMIHIFLFFIKHLYFIKLFLCKICTNFLPTHFVPYDVIFIDLPDCFRSIILIIGKNRQIYVTEITA